MVKSGISKTGISRVCSLLFVLLPAVFLSVHYYSIRAEELAAPSGKVIVGMTKPEAAAYLTFLRSSAAKAIFEKYGFVFLVSPTT